TLAFSWRLVLAPPEVLDYVVAHEVAHLTHMNHSAEFWALVARLCPGFERPRQWLAENGAHLLRHG
ncbi:MAG: M48 family metallopeptidase, partial [Rhodospirillales bacterium]